MILTRTLCLLLVLLAVAPAVSSSADPPPYPPTKVRLRRQGVVGVEPRQWVFVLIYAVGEAEVVTPTHLRAHLKAALPAGSTLEYATGCDFEAGAPLQSGAEMDSFAAFCRRHGIRFIQIPSG